MVGQLLVAFSSQCFEAVSSRRSWWTHVLVCPVYIRFLNVIINSSSIHSKITWVTSHVTPGLDLGQVRSSDSQHLHPPATTWDFWEDSRMGAEPLSSHLRSPPLKNFLPIFHFQLKFPKGAYRSHRQKKIRTVIKRCRNHGICHILSIILGFFFYYIWIFLLKKVMHLP